MVKAFKITQNNQYIQPITLNTGEYIFSVGIRVGNITYKFELRKRDGAGEGVQLDEFRCWEQWGILRHEFNVRGGV